jgi:hypothetical protein
VTACAGEATQLVLAAAPVRAHAVFMAAQANGIALGNRARRIRVECHKPRPARVFCTAGSHVRGPWAMAGFATELLTLGAWRLQEDASHERLLECLGLADVTRHALLRAHEGGRTGRHLWCRILFVSSFFFLHGRSRFFCDWRRSRGNHNR